LLRAFGSVKGVEQASLDELMQAPGMNPKLAQQLWQIFHLAPPAQ
jgi:excinuclease UvrABC nuclease subunit